MGVNCNVRITISSGVMSYLASWLSSCNVFRIKIPCSRMQKHFRNGMIYAQVRHLMNGLCWHFDTVAKLNILCQLLGENVAYGIGVHPPKLGNPYSTQ